MKENMTSPNSHSIKLNLFKVRLNYIIKLNRTKSGATYMAQNLKGVVMIYCGA